MPLDSKNETRHKKVRLRRKDCQTIEDAKSNLANKYNTIWLLTEPETPWLSPKAMNPPMNPAIHDSIPLWMPAKFRQSQQMDL
jgi:hypothetical protein